MGWALSEVSSFAKRSGRAGIGGRVAVHGGEETATRFFGRGAKIGKPRPVPEGTWWEPDPKLLRYPNKKGYTVLRGKDAGRVYINPDLDPIEKAITLRHEYVHRVLTASADTPTGRLLQEGRYWLKKESALFHGLEETVAETVGAGWSGLAYTTNPYVVLLRRAGVVDYAMGAAALGAEGYYLAKKPVEPGQ